MSGAVSFTWWWWVSLHPRHLPLPHPAGPATAASLEMSSDAPLSTWLPLLAQAFSSPVSSPNQGLVAWRSPSPHRWHPGGGTRRNWLNLRVIRRVVHLTTYCTWNRPWQCIACRHQPALSPSWLPQQHKQYSTLILSTHIPGTTSFHLARLPYTL